MLFIVSAGISTSFGIIVDQENVGYDQEIYMSVLQAPETSFFFLYPSDP